MDQLDKGGVDVVPAHYPELAGLAWNRDLAQPMPGQEALTLYETNWRHVDAGALTDAERELIISLTDRFGHGHLLTTR